MEVSKVYQEFLDVVNQNSTYKGSPVSKRQFVDLYNNVSISFVENMLRNRNLDDIRYLSTLRKKEDLSLLDKFDKYNSYGFPEDYLSIIDVSSEMVKGKCTLDSEYLKEIKPEEESIYYNDANTEPDFDYAESLYCLFDKGVSVYKKGFELGNVELSYYKIPQRIEISGYKKLDGSDSVDISPLDLPDNIVLRIVNEMAIKFVQSVENTTQWQMLNVKK